MKTMQRPKQSKIFVILTVSLVFVGNVLMGNYRLAIKLIKEPEAAPEAPVLRKAETRIEPETKIVPEIEPETKIDPEIEPETKIVPEIKLEPKNVPPPVQQSAAKEPLVSAQSTNTQSTNSTLVIVMGSLRGGELAWQSLYRNVLDLNNADLALLLGKDKNNNNNNNNNTPQQYANASLYARAKYHWTFDEYDDWGDAIDLMVKEHQEGFKLQQQSTLERNDFFYQFYETINPKWRNAILYKIARKTGLMGGLKTYHGSGAIIFMIRYFLIRILMQNDYQLLRQYDRIVLTRADHYYMCEHDLSKLARGRLWIPSGSDWGGVTDRHLVVDSKHILGALDILPHLITYPQKYSLFRGNPESVIKERWEQLRDADGRSVPIDTFNRVMFTCGVQGDVTRWRGLTNYTVEEGVHLKYVEEYEQSYMHCKNETIKLDPHHALAWRIVS